MEVNQLIRAKIDHCLNVIEQRVNLGGSAYWKQRDYETVSRLIEDDTNVLLSASTIKRLFQKNYGQAPQTATLNAIAQFAGYQSFQAVSVNQSNDQNIVSTGDDTPKEIKTISAKNKIGSHKPQVFKISIIILVCIGIISFFLIKGVPSLQTKKAGVSFSSTILNTGIPCTVFFNFDVPRTEKDSLWLQPTWDTHKRIYIPYNVKEYHYVYYHPSYHKVKLILNGKEIAETGVHIKTQGWLGVIYLGNDINRPYYLSMSDTTKGNDILEATDDDIEGQKLLQSGEPYKIRYYNIADFEGISGDSLVASFEIYLDHSPTFPCSQGFISLRCKKNRLIISLDEVGCTGESYIRVGSKNIAGRYEDLRVLGLIQKKWQRVLITTKDNKLNININNKNLRIDYEGELGQLMGVVFEFFDKAKIKDFDIKSLKN